MRDVDAKHLNMEGKPGKRLSFSSRYQFTEVAPQGLWQAPDRARQGFKAFRVHIESL
jgi:hypothetical protein